MWALRWQISSQRRTAPAPAPERSSEEECERSTPRRFKSCIGGPIARCARLNLNFYQKARFANSFKWRLIENGVEHGRGRRRDSVSVSAPRSGTGGRSDGPRPGGRAGTGPEDPGQDRRSACACREGLARRAIMPKPWTFFDEYVSLVPGRADALNALGVGTLQPGSLSRGGAALPRGDRHRSGICQRPSSILQLCCRRVRKKPNHGCGVSSGYSRNILERARAGPLTPSRVASTRPTLLFARRSKFLAQDAIALFWAWRQIAPLEGRFDDARVISQAYFEIAEDADCLGGTEWHAQDDLRTTADLVDEGGGDRGERDLSLWRKRSCVLRWANFAMTWAIF